MVRSSLVYRYDGLSSKNVESDSDLGDWCLSLQPNQPGYGGDVYPSPFYDADARGRAGLVPRWGQLFPAEPEAPVRRDYAGRIKGPKLCDLQRKEPLTA